MTASPVARRAEDSSASRNGMGGELSQVLEVTVGFEEQQPALVLDEVGLDVPAGHLPRVDAVVADVAHEPGKLARLAVDVDQVGLRLLVAAAGAGVYRGSLSMNALSLGAQDQNLFTRASVCWLTLG